MVFSQAANVDDTSSQERKEKHAVFVGKLSPHPVLRPECMRTESNPDPPSLWYGFPINPETYRGYLIKKGNPDGVNLDVDDAELLAHPALKILHQLLNGVSRNNAVQRKHRRHLSQEVTA